ncbi:MAG: RagB/SusD family nutrient uptake outer membrane protein [Bacteroidales bacterium]|nr:RagB/SusD family nutrient uptake outer membrane protein [Bacteroidales bacterium]
MKNKIINVVIIAVLLSSACTDLDETLYDIVETSSYGKTPSEIETIVGGTYASLRGFRDNTSISYPTCEYVFFLVECVSDEACIPTRGTDWYDGGRYQEAEYHTYTSINPMVLSAWRYNYTGIAEVNKVIYQVDRSNQTQEEKDLIKAELRGLRAYYYYNLLDLFGNVPLVIDFEDLNPPTTATRLQVFNFVESELLNIVDDLSETPIYGRFTQPVAYTLLARLYLNAEVFTEVLNDNGETETPGTPRWQDCINACDKVTGYSLEPDYFTNFLTANEVSRENIFVIPYDHKAGTLGNYLNSMSYHYNQRLAFSPTGQWQWSANGICGQPGLWSSFDDKDVRKKSMLEGEQINLATGSIVVMANGNPLIYTEEIVDFLHAEQNEGVRLNKYEVKLDEVWERDHDWVVMRYAEVILMKAECLIRLGTPDLARPLIAQIRTRAGLDTPASIDLEMLDDELKYEFVFEGHRRTDNIRSGDYFKASWIKPETPRWRGIFPIPQSEIDKNPQLKQNPGY